MIHLWEFICDNSVVNGKFLLTILDDVAPPGATWQVRWGLVGPGGVVKALPTGATWDAAFISGGSVNTLGDIPVNADGTYVEGVYSFTVQWQDYSSGSNPIQSKNGVEFTFNTIVTKTNFNAADLVGTIDCGNGKVKVVDQTSRSGFVYSAANLRLVWPVETSKADTVTTTVPGSSTAEFSVSGITNYTGVSVFGRAEHSRSKSTTSGADVTFKLRELIRGDVEVPILCAADGCDIATCLEEFYNDINTTACNVGGWSQLPMAKLAQVQQVLAYHQMWLSYKNCLDFVAAETMKEKLKQAINCDCDCETVPTAPAPFTPKY